MNIQFTADNLILSPEMFPEFVGWRNLSEEERYACLQRIFDDALNYRIFQRKRHQKAKERAIRWGAEYDAFLQKHLANGLRLKTAKTAAKRDFIAAHPQTDDRDEYPGCSNPALKRYHHTYLNTISTIPSE